jgi:glutaryl-CoA dehydrogenase
MNMANGYQWDDCFQLDQQLTEDERMIRDAAREYCQDKLKPRVQAMFRNESWTSASSARWASWACWAPPSRAVRRRGPELRELRPDGARVERVDSGYRSMMSVQSSLVMVPINEFGTEAQKQKYLPKLATGEWIGCFGLTEPDHGSDPGSMATRAYKVDGGYRLKGNKMWITNSPVADVFVVWAKDDERPDPRLRAGKGHEGPVRPAIHGKVGLRASITGEIVMDDVFCPKRTPSPTCAA